MPLRYIHVMEIIQTFPNNWDLWSSILGDPQICLKSIFRLLRSINRNTKSITFQSQRSRLWNVIDFAFRLIDLKTYLLFFIIKMRKKNTIFLLYPLFLERWVWISLDPKMTFVLLPPHKSWWLGNFVRSVNMMTPIQRDNFFIN